MDKTRLLELIDLKVHFHTERGRITAVDGVNLTVDEGEIVGIVGESGCGKSVMSQTILRLLEHTDPVAYEGQILFRGENILDYSRAQLRRLRGRQIAMIFQDPLTSLNPVYTIGRQLDEMLRVHMHMTARRARTRTLELLELTGIPSPARCAKQYPHELSGGMQQRVMIAMALACEPKLLIADEPTTALDVTIQAQILDLIRKLNQELNMAVLFITHDLGIVSELCDNVRVMYLGQVVENAPVRSLFDTPVHPYTRGLIRSVPRPEVNRGQLLDVIEGTVPSLFELPKGCRFSPRCGSCDELCTTREPAMQAAMQPNHYVKCHHWTGTEWKENTYDTSIASG